MEMKIRRTLLGGFNRRDVVSYIESIASAREREVADLKRDLERVSAERDAAKRLGGDVAEIRAELEATQHALEETAAGLRRAELERDDAVQRANTTGAKLAEYEQADMQLAEKLAELERVKARVTDIEIEAHDRANKIEQDARDAARAARAEADRLVSELRWKFDEARGSAGHNLASGIRELDAMKSKLESLMDSFGDVGEKLSRVTAKEQSDVDDND